LLITFNVFFVRALADLILHVLFTWSGLSDKIRPLHVQKIDLIKDFLLCKQVYPKNINLSQTMEKVCKYRNISLLINMIISKTNSNGGIHLLYSVFFLYILINDFHQLHNLYFTRYIFKRGNTHRFKICMYKFIHVSRIEEIPSL
jgi:hypothetical protein